MNISERIYRLLLRLYPREHRRRYGEPMATHFRDQYREAQRDGNLLDLWLRTLIDVATTAPMEHMAAARMRNVYPWPEVMLAILPGTLPLFLPPQPDRIDRLLLLGLSAIYLVLLVVYLRQNRPVAWALPILALRAQSGRGRVLAILLPLATCLLLLILLPPLIYSTSPLTASRIDLATLLEQAIHHTLYAAQILAGLALALSLYGAAGRDSATAQ